MDRFRKQSQEAYADGNIGMGIFLNPLYTFLIKMLLAELNECVHKLANILFSISLWLPVWGKNIFKAN